MIDIFSSIQDPEKARAFTAKFLPQYLAPAFGARSKSEIDLLVFTCLVEAEILDPNAPIYDIARAFNLTPARVRTLLFNWQLRATLDVQAAIVQMLRKTRFAKDGTLMTFGVESPLLREEIVARLKQRGVFADASFAKEIVRLPVEAFVGFFDEFVDDETKQKLKEHLVDDKLLADKSFKAIVFGVLGKIGEKVAGEAGKAVAGAVADGAKEALAPAAAQLSEFLVSLLAGDPRTAAVIAQSQMSA